MVKRSPLDTVNSASSGREYVHSLHVSSELKAHFFMTVNVMYYFLMSQSLFEIVRETMFSFPFDIRFLYK